MVRTSVEYADENITVYPQPCPLRCRYCLPSDTRILTKELAWVPISEIQVNDELIGFTETPVERPRKIELSRVVAKHHRLATVYLIRTKNGSVRATKDHLWLIGYPEKGGKGRWRTTIQLREGIWALCKLAEPTLFPSFSKDYLIGYVQGLSDGDGCSWLDKPDIRKDRQTVSSRYRVALTDNEALFRLQVFLEALLDIKLPIKSFSSSAKKPMQKIETCNSGYVEKILQLSGFQESESYAKGYLAGIFDAEGSFSRGILRISNYDRHLIQKVLKLAQNFGFEFVTEQYGLRLRGNLDQKLRFLSLTNPAITRKKLGFLGKTRFGQNMSQIVEVEKVGVEKVYDIETSSHTFFADGFASHNCWASLPFWQRRIRTAHPLEEATRLSRSKRKLTIVVSFTSDSYQPRELGRGMTRRTLEILSKTKHKVMVLTKSALIETDFQFFALTKDKGFDLWVGSTLTSTVQIADEPCQWTNMHRIVMLKQAHDLGLKTWASLEPWLPNVTYPHQIVEATHDFIDWYVLGSLNYAKQLGYVIPEGYYQRELPLAIATLDKYKKLYLLKKELRAHLGKDCLVMFDDSHEGIPTSSVLYL